MWVSPSARATDTRWWPSWTKCSSPIRYTSIGGIVWPRRRAVAIRSQRQRTPGEVGRNLRSNSPCRRATVPTMLSSRISRMPMSRSLRRAQRGDHLLERQHHRHVVGLEPQARRDLRICAAPALAREIGLRVLLWESGVLHQRWPSRNEPVDFEPMIGTDMSAKLDMRVGLLRMSRESELLAVLTSEPATHVGAVRARRLHDAHPPWPDPVSSISTSAGEAGCGRPC